MNNIKVSIVIPVYNGEKYLRDCYTQLSNQTLNDIEIIIVDDGSTDSTLKIGLELEKLNQNCHFYHQENQGASAARNTGITMAHGDYIGFVDVDDQYDNDMYELLYNAALENDLDMVSMDNYGAKGELSIFDDKKEIYELFMKRAINISACFKLFKKQLFKEVSFPQDIKIYEDYMAVFRSLSVSSRVGILNVKKYHYIKHEGSSSRAKVFQEKYFDAITVVNSSCEKIENMYPDLKDACDCRKANTYLRITKIYYLRKHPKEYLSRIKELKKWLKNISFNDARRYYTVYNLLRHYLCLYAMPLFIILIKTLDKE